MKKNLGLELNRGLMNIAEELTNKKGIKMFYSLSSFKFFYRHIYA